ncbi:hypothetical protein FOCC_FOCC017465, partial [Frankliniella occidentalis]
MICFKCRAEVRLGARRWLDDHKWLAKVDGDDTNANCIPCNKGPSAEVQVATAAKKAEISLGAFSIHHSIPPNVSDHLTDTLTNMLPDSKICQKMSLDRTKCTAVVTNVIAKTETEELAAILKEVKFSVLVDKSTDLGSKKNMAIVVKFTDKT